MPRHFRKQQYISSTRAYVCCICVASRLRSPHETVFQFANSEIKRRAQYRFWPPPTNFTLLDLLRIAEWSRPTPSNLLFYCYCPNCGFTPSTEGKRKCKRSRRCPSSHLLNSALQLSNKTLWTQRNARPRTIER